MSLLQPIAKNAYGRLLLEGGIMLFATYGSWSLTQWLLSATGMVNLLLAHLMLSLAQCAIPFMALSFCCQQFENRSVSSIDVNCKNVLRDTSWGILISVGIMSLTVLLLKKVGAYQFVTFCSPNNVLALIVGIITSISAPINEEIFFRGTLFRHLEQHSGSWPALLISGLLFGFGHSWRPYATWHSSLFLAVDLGFLCAGLYMLTRSLWVPIGLHFAWNVCEELIYGMPNSGAAPRVSLLHAVVQGPTWLTGGKFGPEASVIPFGICLILNGVVLALVMRKRTAVQWARIGKATPAAR